MTTHEQDERERTERRDETVQALHSIARSLQILTITIENELVCRGRDTFTMKPTPLSEDCYVCGIEKAITRITPGGCVVTISGQEVGATPVSLCSHCAGVTSVTVRQRER